MPSIPGYMQHLLLSGPFLGGVGAIIQRRLVITSPRMPQSSTGHVVRQVLMWHGRYLGDYYITPGQFFIQECLAISVACWMIFVIIGLVGLGIRTEMTRRQKSPPFPGG